MTRAEYLAAQAWEMAAFDHVRNVLVCVTGGLRPEHWQPLRAAVRSAVMRPGGDDNGKESN